MIYDHHSYDYYSYKCYLKEKFMGSCGQDVLKSFSIEYKDSARRVESYLSIVCAEKLL